MGSDIFLVYSLARSLLFVVMLLRIYDWNINFKNTNITIINFIVIDVVVLRILIATDENSYFVV